MQRFPKRYGLKWSQGKQFIPLAETFPEIKALMTEGEVAKARVIKEARNTARRRLGHPGGGGEEC